MSSDWIDWLASLPAGERDAAFDQRFGTADSVSPGEHLIGHHASGVAAIVRALVDAPIADDDVLIDLGAGLGKVLFIAKLLTRAKIRGVEIQESLAARARERGLDVEHADVRDADIRDGTIFFLYNPFTGPVIERTLDRLHEVATDHSIVVCSLGLDLRAPWLSPRPSEEFWLSIYDSVIERAKPRKVRAGSIDERAQRLMSA